MQSGTTEDIIGHISWAPVNGTDDDMTANMDDGPANNGTTAEPEMLYDAMMANGSAGNVTCEGAQDYCNLTREEYIDMLITYLYPTWSEMVLIGLHVIVFFIGLVSEMDDDDDGGGRRHFDPVIIGNMLTNVSSHRLATHWCA